jgi:hypothetical protein
MCNCYNSCCRAADDSHLFLLHCAVVASNAARLSAATPIHVQHSITAGKSIYDGQQEVTCHCNMSGFSAGVCNHHQLMGNLCVIIIKCCCEQAPPASTVHSSTIGNLHSHDSGSPHELMSNSSSSSSFPHMLPKVMVPFVTKPNDTPRDVEVQR